MLLCAQQVIQQQLTALTCMWLSDDRLIVQICGTACPFYVKALCLMPKLCLLLGDAGWPLE